MKLLVFLLLQVFLNVSEGQNLFQDYYDYGEELIFKWGENPVPTPTSPTTKPTPSTAATIPSTPSTTTTTTTTKPTPTTAATTPSTTTTATTTPTTKPTPTTAATTPSTTTTATTTPTTKPTPSTAATTPSTTTTATTTPTTKPTPTTAATTPSTTTTATTTPTTKPTPTTAATTPSTPSTAATIRTTPTTPITTTTPSTPSTTQNPLTVLKSVLESQISIAIIKVQFENKLDVDIEYVNRFSDRLNTFRGEFYAALEEQVYRYETTKRDALRNALRNKPDIECISGHDVSVNNARKLGQSEFDFCEATVKIEVQQQKNQLKIAKERVQDEIKKAELQVSTCKRGYFVGYDLDIYISCTKNAKINLVQALGAYNTSIRGKPTQNRTIELAECADKSLAVIEKTLNENYKIIKNCLQGSKRNDNSYVVTTFVDTYTVDLTSFNLKNQIEKATNHLTTNIEETSRNAATLKAIFQKSKTIRDRAQVEIREELELLREVNMHRIAYIKATTDLASFSRAKDCINQGNDKVRDNLNKRANEVRDCSLRFNMVPTEATVNSFLSNLKNLDINEGLTAIVNCFANRKTILTSNLTVSCSDISDVLFNHFVTDVDNQLQTYYQQLNQLSDLFDICQSNVLPTLLAHLDIDRMVFELCVESKTFEKYTLKV